MQEIKELISQLSKNIVDELHDAEKYAKSALYYKNERQTLAELYYSLSLDEMKHMNQLHNSVVKMIDEAKGDGEEIQERTQETYSCLHELFIEKSKEIRMLQTMFRE